MEKNFGTKQRNPMRAASKLLNQSRESGGISYSTVATVLKRFEKFVDFINQHEMTQLDKVKPSLVKRYAAYLLDTDYSASYKQNLLSAVNTVFTLGYAKQNLHWTPITGRAEGLPPRSNVRRTPTTSKEQLSDAQENMSSAAAAVAGLARELGLRSKEASLLDAASALKQAEKTSQVTITEGTKGGRRRIVPVNKASQIQALSAAVQVQGGGRSLIPEDQTWAAFRATTLYEGRAALKAAGISNYHALRAAYAADRYLDETGQPAPCNAFDRRVADRDIDLQARLIIAEELGHGRVDVLVSYVGGQRA